MPRSKPVRLREADAHKPLHESDVIDAQFRLIGRKRRAVGALARVLLVAFFAALIGFMIPQAWNFFATVGARFAAG